MSIVLQGVERVAGAERILYPTDLSFEPGTITTLLGPIRAGKTSLMRLMAGLDAPTAGKIIDNGTDVTGVDVRRRSVSMVYQQFINYPNFSVFDNIASPLRVAGHTDRATVERKVRDIAERLGLTPLLKRLPAELSGGQQQRCALARAMVKESRLLLLDEPLVNLDYKLREGLRAEMKALFRDSDRIVVYATTEPLEALMLGGRTCVLREGRVYQVGPTLEVYRQPNSVATASLISDPPMNFLPGAVRDGALRLNGGAIIPLPQGWDSLPAGPYRFGLHASQVSLDANPAAIALTVTLELAEISGSETLLHARYKDDAILLQADGVRHHEIGETMQFHLDPASLYAFDQTGALVRAPRFEAMRIGEAQRGAHSAA